MGVPLRTIAFHILGWVLLFGLVVSFISYSPGGIHIPDLLAPPFLLFFFVYLFIFYLNTEVLVPKLYLKKQHLLYILCILLLLVAVSFLMPFDGLVNMRVHQPDGPPPFRGGPPPFAEGRRPPGPGSERKIHLDITSIVIFFAVWSFGTALQIFQQWRKTERRALQAESEKISSELSFLKAQINPHFLFNTLNNIYSLAITKSDRTPDAVMKLSQILRYVTDEAGKDQVSLQNEIACINNYIELQKLRLTEKVDLQYKVTGEMEGKKLAPMLLMPFIENAFKYGISNHENCRITTLITADTSSLHLFCQNELLVKETAEERTGIGISNVKKRLEYLYPGKHSLHIYTEKGMFTVDLLIQL